MMAKYMPGSKSATHSSSHTDLEVPFRIGVTDLLLSTGASSPMKIDVVDRKRLERLSRNEWPAMLATTRVISIRSTDGWDGTFPIPPGVRPHDNLLCLTFDDCTTWDEAWREHEMPELFNEWIASRVIRFVNDDSLPLVVQCTAGISRSGAIGVAFDEFFNVREERNPADHDYFVARNPQVRPNALVMRIMREALGTPTE